MESLTIKDELNWLDFKFKMAQHPHRNQVVGGDRLGPQQVFPPTQYNNNQNFNNNGSHFPSQVQYFGNFPNSSQNYWGNGHVEYNQFHHHHHQQQQQQQQPQSMVNDFLPREIQLPQAPILNSPGKNSINFSKLVRNTVIWSLKLDFYTLIQFSFE